MSFLRIRYIFVCCSISCCDIDDAETVEEDYEDDKGGEVEIDIPSNNQNSSNNRTAFHKKAGKFKRQVNLKY